MRRVKNEKSTMNLHAVGTKVDFPLTNFLSFFSESSTSKDATKSAYALAASSDSF